MVGSPSSRLATNNWRTPSFLKEPNMPAKDLNALFLDTLKDIYYAEKQIYKS
jgi:hypothetical protein